MKLNYTEFIVRVYPPKAFKKSNFYTAKWLKDLLFHNIYARKITVKKVKDTKN